MTSKRAMLTFLALLHITIQGLKSNYPYLVSLNLAGQPDF